MYKIKKKTEKGKEVKTLTVKKSLPCIEPSKKCRATATESKEKNEQNRKKKREIGTNQTGSS